MKLFYLLLLLVTSTTCSALDMTLLNWFSGKEEAKLVSPPAWLSSQIATTTPIFLESHNGHNAFLSTGSSFANVSTTEQFSILGSQSLFAATGNSGYYTEPQFTLNNELLFTGQWAQVQQPYNNTFNFNRLLLSAEWSLSSESRASKASVVGLNWVIIEDLQAYVKLQTVNGSAWVPHLNIPRFIAQDTDEWALAAVEVVYSF